MNNEEKIINIDDKELPVDKFKNSEVAYDYRKRTTAQHNHFLYH